MTFHHRPCQVGISLAGVLLGLLWLAYFTSEMVEMVTSANESEEHARQKITRVAAYMREERIPADLVGRCRRHLTTVLLHRRLALSDSADLLSELSAPLRAEVALHRCHRVVLSPKFVAIVAGTPLGLTSPALRPLCDRLATALRPPCYRLATALLPSCCRLATASPACLVPSGSITHAARAPPLLQAQT